MAKKTTEPAVEDTKIEELEPATICCGEEFFDNFKEVLSAEEAAQYLGIALLKSGSSQVTRTSSRKKR